MKKEPTINELYDLTDHLMVDLEIIILLSFMTYMVDLDAYE